jgi:hypothetical protein
MNLILITAIIILVALLITYNISNAPTKPRKTWGIEKKAKDSKGMTIKEFRNLKSGDKIISTSKRYRNKSIMVIKAINGKYQKGTIAIVVQKAHGEGTVKYSTYYRFMFDKMENNGRTTK